jgi:c-di-GMP-binding flagellar brake protein YcgR
MTEAQASAGLIASQFLTDKGEIERVFRIFRDRCSPVQLHFGRSDDEYTARVLEVTAHQFLLEDIRPRDGMKLMRAQEPFSLAGRVDGIYARVSEIRVARTAEDRGVPYFILNLPSEMLYQQRRRAARFRLPLSVSKDGARLTLHRERALSGYLVDISAGGCRVVFDVKSDPEIQPDEVVERSEIEIPNLLSLMARTIIRHHSYNRQTGQLSCGIEFTEMQVRDRRRLEQFIQKIARITDPVS